jgi:hypothetical protein
MSIQKGFLNNSKILKQAKKISFILRKPVLNYLEMHLTDHCNLNCMGCGHFSPLAGKWFADIRRHEKDMQRLSSLFYNIKTFRLMGGEPLLHPMIEHFFIITRKYFPKTHIELVTNGVLLTQMPDSFWNTCIENNIFIELTVYPILENKLDTIREYMGTKGVAFNVTKSVKFHSNINLIGNSNPEKSFHFCRSKYFCPFLREGEIYSCSRQALFGYFNKQFKTDIPLTGSIDMYKENINGWDILYSINKESDTCCFCATELRWFDWEKSKKDIAEWIVSRQIGE